MRKEIAVLCACLASAACSMNGSQNAPITQATADLAGEPFDQVLLRVKQEVGLYRSQSVNWQRQLQQDFAQLGVQPKCGNGNINFQIKSVKMEFATVVGRTTSGELALKIPFGPGGAGNVGPGISGSFEFNGTNTLDYTYYVPDRVGAIDDEATRNIAQSAVIGPTLTMLRRGLLRATAQLPCMSDTPKDKDDTFTFAVELKQDANPKVGFNFLIVSASAGIDLTHKRSNTITVTFHPTPTGGAMIF